MRIGKKLVSLILTILTLMGIFSCSTTVLAEEYNSYIAKQEYQDKILTETVENENPKAEIVCEIIEKRNEFSKTYKRADGSFTTVFSQTPLHTYTGTEWKEIDNSLQSDGDIIENTNGKFDIEFPENLSSNDKITVENNGENLSFSLNNIDDSTAAIAPKEESADVVENDLGKPVSEITYENIGENTDVQYIVSSNSVKENIIVSDKNSLRDSYSFDIEKGKLVAILGDDNSLTFKNARGETVFTIPAPVMTDAENVTSYDISVSVANENTETLTLTYTPSREWLQSKERVYPVTIDPVIEMPSDNETIIQDTMVGYDCNEPETRYMNFRNQSDGAAINTGTIVDGDFLHADILVNINTSVFAGLINPEIEITDVNYHVRGCVEGGNVLLKEINGTWDADEITYDAVYPADNSTPQITYGTKIIDFASGGANTDYGNVYFNITDIFRASLNSGMNADFAIVAEDSNVRGDFIIGATETTKVFNSYVSLDYIDTSCGNDNFEYLTQELGRAGTTYVNSFSRSLTMTRNDISMDGLRMPVNVGFAFNPTFRNFADIYLTATGMNVELPYGNNWLPLNLQALFSISPNQWQAFTGEGTLVTFNQITETVTETVDGVETTTTEIVFESDETSDSGYSLELIDTSKSVSTTNLRLISPDGTATYFYSSGVVKAICSSEDELANTSDVIRVYYNSESSLGINKITDGAGRQYVFSYNETTNLLEKINCLTADGTQIKAGTTDSDLCVTYSYDTNGNLTGITYPDGKTVTYTYSGNNLTKAQNIDGYSIQYTYDEGTGKVTKIEEFSGITSGNLITLESLSNRQVKIVDTYTGTQIYQFGRDGKLHYTFDDNGNFCKTDNAVATDENVYTENGWAVVPENLLKNGSFDTAIENTPTDWTVPFPVEIEDVTNVYDNSCKVFSLTETEALQSQTVVVDGGKNFTFSLYAKYIGEEIQTTDKLYLRITAIDEDENETSKSVQISPTNEFEQYSVTVATETETDCVTVEFGLKNKTGNFLVNNAQLERGNGTADFNYIENGTFNSLEDNSPENWSSATVVNDSIVGEDVNAVKLTGGLPQYENEILNDNISAITQTVKINGKKGDIFSVGGWFKGEFDDNHISGDVDISTSQAVNSLAQIKVSYSYDETTTDENGAETTQHLTEEFAVDFEPLNDSWQYAVDSFALKADVATVDVTVMAKNIINDSFVTNFSLTKNETGELVEEETEEEETENEICSCGCEDCIYGDNCPCTGAVEEKCQCPDCLRGETTTEDSFGNTLSNKSFDGINYIETLSDYTADGNYLTSYTDENGNVTTYDYNTLNGILEAVTSPMGTGTSADTTTTSYEYDAMGNMVCVSTDNKALQYVYTNDRLTELVTPNGRFKIIYDAWGQVLSVNVVEDSNLVPLVTYTYNTGALRTQVATATYRNDATKSSTYQYEYDEDGNVTNISINNNLKHTITYGSLGEITGIKNEDGRTVKYTDNGVYIYNAFDELVYTSVTDDEGKETEENYGIKYKEQETQYNYDPATGYTTESTALDIASYYRVSQSAVTDWFGREKSHTITVYDITEETEETIGKISTEYSYSSAEDGKTSSNIEKYINKTYNSDGTTVRVFDGYSYEYDKQNRISAIKQLDVFGAETEMYSYEYDKLGQLVRYNDSKAQKSYTYTYDGNGNILTKSEYTYATGVLIGEPQITTYSYDNAWADKLTKVGTQEIKYDSIGNPTTYLGATLTWEGRQLTSYSNAENTFNYEYDENGMRYRTTITNDTDGSVGYLDYVWVDSKLISISFTSDELNQTVKYLYNDFDEPVGFVATREDGSVDTFYYLKNAQGDITHIVSAAGKKMVSFTYDVFGKRTVTYQANGSTTPGQIELLTQMKADLLNPFAYRGYCYDYDMGMYYLQSRYYDPNTGRFINADDTNYLNATGTVLSCNLFAYCENDPVNRVDPKGCASSILVHFKSDKQGRSILKHYLTGKGKKLTISSWSSYMNNAPICKSCRSHSINAEKTLYSFIVNKVSYYTKYVKYFAYTYKKTLKLNVQIQNGESCIGYNYLHGVNMNVGGLKLSFMIYLIKAKNSSEKYRHKIIVDCEWNDIIDPNLTYTTDYYKSLFAEKLPFVKPTNYTISIKWRITKEIPVYKKVGL